MSDTPIHSSPTLSFWEQNSFFRDLDVIIIGSGIVGLNAAIALKEKEPRWRVAVLERGVLPSGASTRNAGFACFGSMTELLDDVAANGEAAMLALVEKRWLGLQRLRQRVGDANMDYQGHGAYELFLPEELERFEHCMDNRHQLNQQLHSIIGVQEVFTERSAALPSFRFGRVSQLLYNNAEGQIDTGNMMQTLLHLVREKGVEIFNGCGVEKIEEEGTGATVLCTNGWVLSAKKVLVCNNGFAKELFPELEVEPARNQVLITKEIPQLNWQGCFHYQSGYFYFRNVGKRILLGGGRHLAKAEENTTQFQITDTIKSALLTLLQEVILPNQTVAIEQWWAGILGIGSEKKPIIKQISPSVFTAVRLGGMGVAIGALVGEEGADLLHTT
jgi:gamma-glutamylputrescine oxidase